MMWMLVPARLKEIDGRINLPDDTKELIRAAIMPLIRSKTKAEFERAMLRRKPSLSPSIVKVSPTLWNEQWPVSTIVRSMQNMDGLKSTLLSEERLELHPVEAYILYSAFVARQASIKRKLKAMERKKQRHEASESKNPD